MSAPAWSLALHGGARSIAPELEDANRKGAKRALEAGVAILRDGGTALDACMACVLALEADPTFNAGAGAVRNRDGETELDAAIMDGATLDIGAVGALKHVDSPILVARLLLRQEATFVAGDGALELARTLNLIREGAPHPAGPHRGKDTVGAIARDSNGHFAVAISTGGLDGALPGRIGDAPLPGCGFYADDETGAVCFSGDGERIARTMLAARVIQSLERDDHPQGAAELSLRHLARIGGEAGAIVMDKSGAIGWAHNSDHFTVAMQTAGAGPQVHLRR